MKLYFIHVTFELATSAYNITIRSDYFIYASCCMAINQFISTVFCYGANAANADSEKKLQMILFYDLLASKMTSKM